MAYALCVIQSFAIRFCLFGIHLETLAPLLVGLCVVILRPPASQPARVMDVPVEIDELQKQTSQKERRTDFAANVMGNTMPKDPRSFYGSLVISFIPFPARLSLSCFFPAVFV